MVQIGDIGKIIAGINPDKYAVRDEDFGYIDKSGFKKALKEDFWQGLKEMDKYNLKAASGEEHKLIYDSSSETLEPVYFWILDMMKDLFKGKVDKLADNFVSSAGSGHFSELMGKASRMQEEAMKMMQ